MGTRGQHDTCQGRIPENSKDQRSEAGKEMEGPVFLLLINKTIKNDTILGASLVVQWLRVCLPMQGTRVRALVWEDPTCHGATGPVSHNY